MKKLLLALGLVSSLATLAGTAAATGPEILLANDTGYHCIGGAICGVDQAYVLDVGSPYLITRVLVDADDNVGDKTKAHLQCYVDGVFVGELDVKKEGSVLTFQAGFVGRRIELRSVNENHNANGDETQIHYVAVYGETP